MIGRKIDKDALSQLPKSNKIDIRNANSECLDKEYKNFLRYIKDKNPEIYHLEKFEDRNSMSQLLSCEKIVCHVSGSTVGSIHYRNGHAYVDGLLIGVSEDVLREEIKKLFPKELYVQRKIGQRSPEED